MLLVLMLGVDPLNVHMADIGLILVTQLVHSSNQFVPLASQVLQLLVKGDFVLPVLDLFASEVLQLDV